jgi:hypothetical protein
MPVSQLPVSGLVNVSINLASAPAQAQSLSNMMIVGSTDIIDTYQRYRQYATLASVATDFGTTAPEYNAAVEWFGQSPQPGVLYIARWAQTATRARLQGGVVSPTNQLLATWNAITAGALQVTVNGTVINTAAINFSTATTLNGVAAMIQTAIGATVSVTWNSSYQQFMIATVSTGATATISFAQASTAPSTTDISGMLVMQATSSGDYVVNGIAAESALSAVTLLDTMLGQKWYGVFVCGAVDADHLAIAAYIEGASTKHAYGVNTQEGGVLVATDTTNIAYQLKQLAYRKTWTQYSSGSLYSIVSAMARLLTTNFNGSNTTITLMYKTEPGVVPETINANQLAALVGNNCNVFVTYDNATSIIQPGVAASGDYIDTIFGADWLAVTIQNTLYNLLYSSSTKIPQTDSGTHILVVGIESVCVQAVTNGLCAPGTWTQGGFGTLNQGDFLPKGFYVFAPLLSTQNPADRAARKSVPIQVAIKLAGAIQTVSVLLNINR